jgi:ethanolamine permease
LFLRRQRCFGYGAYLNVQFSSMRPLAAVGAYVIFMALSILGVRIAATFELRPSP